MFSRAKLIVLRNSPALVALFACFACGTAKAQFSVAPSQTGSFFDDLRARTYQMRHPAVDQSSQSQGAGINAQGGPAAAEGTSGTYQFDQGQYQGQPTVDERPVGSPVDATEVYAREVGTPVGSGSTPTTYSRRLAGDLSGYNGPYPSTGTFFAPSYVSDPFLGGRRNIRLGQLNIGLGLTEAVEFNDNITRAHTDKLSDVISSTYLNIDANYQITQYNRLTLTTSLGVNHYFNHPEVSTNGKEFDVQVLPGSSIAFDMKVGPVIVVFYDRLSVRPASQDQFALDNRDIFGVFQNDAGVAASWAINSKTNLSIDFNRSDSHALEQIDEIYNRSVTSVSASLAFTPTGSWTIGLEGSASLVNYQESFNNDGKTLTGGLFFVLPITNATLVKAAAGIQHFSFDTPPKFTRTVSDADLVATQNAIDNINTQLANVGRINFPDAASQQAEINALTQQQQQLQEELAQQQITKQREDTQFNSRTYDTSSDFTGYYYNVSVANRLNARVTQQLTFGHESSLNTVSNYVTADYVSYGVGIIAYRGARLTLSGYFENADDSGGRLAEDLKQFGFDVLLTHRLSDHLTAGFGYHYGNVDSNLALRDYQQHAFTVDLNYALTTKWNVGVGYRYWRTNADDPTQSFTQNRVILSTNYNF